MTTATETAVATEVVKFNLNGPLTLEQQYYKIKNDIITDAKIIKEHQKQMDKRKNQ